jgi:dTDP-4-dehydrorhamnose reductase
VTRVLVTGAAGQVGLDFLDVLAGRTPLGGDPSFQPDGQPVSPDEFAVMGLTHHDLDVADADAVLRAVTMARPDVIVHLAAYTAVDKAESDEAACFAVNAEGTGNLSVAAHAVGAHLIAVSTDYVYDGQKGATYVETDATNPLGVYGASKLEGERRCQPDDTIVRTSWVMGVRGRNVLHVIADRAAKGEPVRFVADQTGTPTFSADLARALVTLVRARPGGVWHVANSGTTTWFDVACAMAEEVGAPEGFVTAITTEELSPTPAARRPVRSDLSTAKWVANGWAPLPPWRASLSRFARDRG